MPPIKIFTKFSVIILYMKKIISDAVVSAIVSSSQYVYDNLGVGHTENIYRNGLSVEIQERGWQVATEYPITVRFTTSNNKISNLGTEYADIYLRKKIEGIEITAVIEVKAIAPMGKSMQSKKEFFQLSKYVNSINEKLDFGFLINFPNIPAKGPEIIFVQTAL